MSARRRVHQALAQLRQMAALEAGGPELIAPVLAALHQVLGFDSGGYIHPRSDGELDVHMENPAMQAAMPEYFEPHIMHSEQQVLVRSSRRFEEAVRHERGVQALPQLIRVPLPELRRSDFYNAILRPGGADDVLSLALRTPQGRGVGILKLYRRSGERAFTAADAAVLGRLEGWLARALQPQDRPGGEGGAACGEGLLIVTPMGRLQWASPEGQTLLAQAFGAPWRGVGRGELPPAVQQLLQQLLLRPQAETDDGAAQLALRNARGWFSLRATLLLPAGGAGEAVAIHIVRHLPQGARLLAALGQLAVPQRQRELAYWLARGLPEQRIAERMGVSANTVAYHRRQLYASLDVCDRQELLQRLPPALRQLGG